MFLWDKLIKIKSWAIANFWNLFSCIGVIATLYLGFFYVPDYVEEIGLNKQKLVHQELVADIQELLFYNQKIKLDDIQEIINGKELSYSIKYKYTSRELLNQIQDDFLKNKFIPLTKRNELMLNIKELRSKYIEPTERPVSESNYLKFISSITTILTGLISLLAIASIISKRQADIETEVDISSSFNIKDEIVNIESNSNNYAAAYEFESMVGDVIDELNINLTDKYKAHKNHYDFLIKILDTEHIVEVKAFSRLLGLGTAKEFLNTVTMEGKPGVLVVKSGLTKRALEFIETHNNLTDNNKIHLIIGQTKQDIKKCFLNVIQKK
ncbi:hypothetical protein [Aeromonas veronii]|uniref:hypothetical protein n=1 Tax=Aeromonas veronii TaxID=654 RepID=UPI0038E2250C